LYQNFSVRHFDIFCYIFTISRQSFVKLFWFNVPVANRGDKQNINCIILGRVMKKQKRLIVTLVSGFILGGVSSLGLADDCGDPSCAHSYKSYQSGQYPERRDGCAQRSDESWEQRDSGYESGCAQRSDESLQERDHDYGKSGCAQRSDESWQERDHDYGKSGCAQRSDESWEQRDSGYESGCAQRSDESWQERERKEREAARVQRQIEREIDALVESELDALEQRYESDALEQRQDKCRQVEAVVPEERSGCGDRYLEGNRQNRGCQVEVVCPNR
jgi:hypothetical protein